MTLRLLKVSIPVALSLGLFMTNAAHALQVSELGVGVSRTAPMGTQYIGFRSGWSFHTDAIIDGVTFLGPGYKFQIAGQYQSYAIQNVTSTRYNLASIVGGFQLQTPTGKKNDQRVSPFFSLLGGMAFDWISLSSGNTTLVFSAGGTLQAIPGIEIPVSSTVSLCTSFPIQAFFLARTLYVWNGLVNVRISL